jgi:hypothetical protein
MRLTWRDGITTLLVVFIGLVFYLWATGTDLAVISEIEGALAVIAIAGLAMWLVGGTSGDIGSNWFTALMVVLAAASVVVFIIGWVTLEPWTVAALAIVLALMWLGDLLYREFGAPAHLPTHA